MNVINLNSQFDLSQAQISFTESVIGWGDDNPYDSISCLITTIPIFLLNPESMPEHEKGQSEKPASEWFGFYQHSAPILGIQTPIIGLCPERIIGQVTNDDELIVLIAKIIIHEFAHATMKQHPSGAYTPIDDFYKWMEEPMANLITLEYFKKYESRYRNRRAAFRFATTLFSPFNYIKTFISQQPDNYRLGIDLYEHRVFQWRIWSNNKAEIQKKAKEKADWLNYVKLNVGRTDKKILQELFDQLHK